MPNFRGQLSALVSIDVEASDMYEADEKIRNMSHQEKIDRMKIEEIDYQTDEFPEEF